MFAVTEVPATVHAPEAPDAAEAMPETAVAEHRRDVYSTLKLDVTVDSIKLEFFTGDSDLVCYYGKTFDYKHISLSVHAVFVWL